MESGNNPETQVPEIAQGMSAGHNTSNEQATWGWQAGVQAKEGLGLSQKKTQLEFFSGIDFPAIKGHRGKAL